MLFDLLTEEEHIVDQTNARFRFDIPLLARRLSDTIDSVAATETAGMKIGLFGASMGAAAALIAAAARVSAVAAVDVAVVGRISRGNPAASAGSDSADRQRDGPYGDWS
jgi:fermentation-respiration switch protein FrsA (DUF1100 family)